MTCCRVHAADGIATELRTDFSTADRATTFAAMLRTMPACKEFAEDTAVADAHGGWVSLFYPHLNFGTTESFPLANLLDAEARPATDDRWRLFVHFRGDVVRLEAPHLHGRSSSNLFFCDADRRTVEALASAFNRLRDFDRDLPSGFSGAGE